MKANLIEPIIAVSSWAINVSVWLLTYVLEWNPCVFRLFLAFFTQPEELVVFIFE